MNAMLLCLTLVSQHSGTHGAQTGGTVGGVCIQDIDMAGFMITDTTQALDLGSACTTSHSLGTTDVCIAQDFEVDGTSYFDGAVEMYSDLDLNGAAITDSTQDLDLGTDINVGANIAGGDYVDIDENGLSGATIGSDAAPGKMCIAGQNAWSQAAANKTGADLYIGAGMGSKTITIDDFNNCGTDTVTLTIDGSANVLTEASEWTAATDDATTATSLAAAVDALSGVSATATASVVYIEKDNTVSYLTMTESDATCTTVANNTNGTIYSYYPVFFKGLVTFGGSASLVSTLNVQDNWNFTLGSSNDTYFRYLTGPDPDATVMSLGDDSRILYINDEVDRNTAYTMAQQTNPTVVIQSANELDETERIYFAHDQTDGVIDVGKGDVKLGNKSHIAGDALTSGGTDDYTLKITQTLNDSGAAGGTDVWRGLKMNVTQTDTTGWDNLYLMDLQADTVPIMTVTPTGEVDVYDAAGDGRYWREFHIGASKVAPAAAGATPTVINTATFVYLLDATTEYLYFSTDIHDDWDGASDVVVTVSVALAGAETANDIINGEVVAEYVGEHEDIDTTIKTQTRAINHDITSDNGQGMVHKMYFILDYDLVDNVIQVEDKLSLRFRLDSVGGGTDVAAVWFKYANVKYRTSKPALEISSFPTEG